MTGIARPSRSRHDDYPAAATLLLHCVMAHLHENFDVHDLSVALKAEEERAAQDCRHQHWATRWN